MEEPTIAGLVQFVKAQDPMRPVNDDQWWSCAVGEYWRWATGREFDDGFYCFTHEVMSRSTWYKAFSTTYVCPRNGFWRNFFGLPEPKMYVKKRTYRDLQVAVRKLEKGNPCAFAAPTAAKS